MDRNKHPYNIITHNRRFVYMRKVKKIALILSIILLYTVFAGSLSASAAFKPKFTLHSEGVYMVNTDTDIVVVSKNADKKMYPASTTKIMTCLVALEEVKDFNAYVYCPYAAYNEFSGSNPNFGGGVSNADIQPLQNNLTYMDALYALMVRSACEAANIIAYNVGGESIENFVRMMNEKAAAIGCRNTHFSNPHGLFDENNYTTPYDMYLITKYAIDNYPRFMDICDTYSYEMPPNENNPDGYLIAHTNKMMQPTSEYYYEGVHGIKTGSIDRYYYKNEDGTFNYDNVEYGSRALVTTAEKDGFHYIIVSMGAPYCNPDGTSTETLLSFTDHINLYDWAFNEFEYALVINKNEQISQIEVDKGKNADKVGLIVTENFYTLLPKSLDTSTIQKICTKNAEELEAPVEKGAEMGMLELRLNGETLTKMKLVTEKHIDLDMAEYYKEKIMNVIETPQFVAIVILLVVLIILFIITSSIRNSHNRRVAEMQRRRKIGMAPQKKKNIRRR